MTGSDITAEVEAKRAARQSEERFRDFAAAASDWFWEMGPDLRFTYFSDDVVRKTGVPASWHIGKTRQEVSEPDLDGPEWRQHIGDLENRRPFQGFVHSRRHIDGTQLGSPAGIDDHGAPQCTHDLDTLKRTDIPD